MSKRIMKSTPSVKKVIKRIKRMEKHFNRVSNSVQSGKLCDRAVKKSIKMLDRYYRFGKWMGDYILDEKGILPNNLRRGVLSEDGLYDLFCDIDGI